MKYLMLAMVIFLFSCSSKQETKEDLQFSDYKPYLLKYVEKQYVFPAQKELDKLVKKEAFLKNKIRIAPVGKLKSLFLEKLSETHAQIEVQKLWPLYHKTLSVKSDGKDRKNAEADKLISKIKKRYKELNGQDFPDVEQEFKDKYLNKLQASKSQSKN